MQKNLTALVTLMRNRLNSNTTTVEEKVEYFISKGLHFVIKDDIYFLKSNSNNSELAAIPSGIIFRGADVVCYHGFPTERKTYTETKSGIFIWNQNTVLFNIIEGRKAFLYFDKKWECADDKKPQTTVAKSLMQKIYNIESLDPRYTYELVLSETGTDSGLYLVSMYDNKKYFELGWEEVDTVASRHKFKRPPLYRLESGQNIEISDLPIIAQDQCLNKFEIHEI